MTNMVPPSAELEMDIRTVPGVSHEDILRQTEEVRCFLAEEFPGAEIRIKILNDRPAVGTVQDNEYVKRILSLAKDMGMNPEPRGTHFYTDGSQLIPSVSVPFVIAGPGMINRHIVLMNMWS